MSKKIAILFIIIFLSGLFFLDHVFANELSERLKGKILLQVEDAGQAWYLEPESNDLVFLGSPDDAFRIMRELSLGISEQDFNLFNGYAPTRLAGRILLRAEANGEAYYVSPDDLRMYYLGKPIDAFRIMKEQGLGISDKDLDAISVKKSEDKIIKPESTEDDCADYCLHKDVAATVFWIGEPIGKGSSEDNSLSCWDDDWQEHFGGYDNYQCRNSWYPCEFIPGENPFYVSLPYDTQMGLDGIAMKNRWVKLARNGIIAYAQVEDCGPYVYDDADYVFGCQSPKNKKANGAGMDVSPALRDYLEFTGLNNDENKLNWQFVGRECVKEGPWLDIITESSVNWH